MSFLLYEGSQVILIIINTFLLNTSATAQSATVNCPLFAPNPYRDNFATSGGLLDISLLILGVNPRHDT